MDHMEGTVLVFESKIATNAKVYTRTNATHYRIPSIPSDINPDFSQSPSWRQVKMATSPLLGVPMVGKDQYRYMTPTSLGSPWFGWIIIATSPLPSRGRHGGDTPKWLHQPFLVGVPIVRRYQNGYITLALFGSTLWGYIEMDGLALPSQGPHGGERSKWQHHPCLIGVPMVGRDPNDNITLAFFGSAWWGHIKVATSPLPSWGPQGRERSKCDITPAFLGS